MTDASERKQRAKAIFMQALEQESAELRAQFIDKACAGDQELRDEVEELIASLQDAGSFMERKPAADIEQTFVTENTPEAIEATFISAHDEVSSGGHAFEAPGSMIGPYKLLEAIGEGGMGTVWVAQQSKPIKRKVAIKLNQGRDGFATGAGSV